MYFYLVHLRTNIADKEKCFQAKESFIKILCSFWILFVMVGLLIKFILFGKKISLCKPGQIQVLKILH